MRLAFLLFLSFVTSVHSEPAKDYYEQVKGLKGPALRQALHELIDDHTVIEYGETRVVLGDLHQDPADPANLIQVYTRQSVPKLDLDAWNREHLWPRARGNTDKKGPDDTDLHHLFPSNYKVNANRASLLFDLTSPPRHSKRWSMDPDSFQPPREAVGDIARALFYMAVRYDGSDRQTSNLTLVNKDFQGAEMGHLDTLLKWHQLDPPDEAEKRRNQLIFEKYQKNRNPFIDHPEFVFLIWKPSPNPDSLKK